MIDDALLAKFDRIQDLPVSEEMLGAYLEENLSPDENKIVQNEIDSDLTLMNLAHSVNNDDIDSSVFSDSALIDSIDLPLITNEYPIIEGSFSEYAPSIDSIDSDFSIELPNMEDENLNDLDSDISNE